MNMPEINGLFWVQKVANLIKWVWQKRGSSLGDEKYRIGVSGKRAGEHTFCTNTRSTTNGNCEN